MKFTYILKKFLQDHGNPEYPLLLGLSGGPDSMAIFHLLIDLKNKSNLKFAVAHVNHNWRKESCLEAEQLKKMAENEAVAFHLLELKPENLKGNLELACRQERLKFFKSLCDQFSYQAVILGHHLDDQAETVLKRLFEGASFCKLKSLKEKTLIDGLMVWRPFLNTRKKEIIDFIEKRKIVSFQDSTNLDPAFTRGKFRTNIIPALSKEFGKDITEPLYRIGNESLELEEYLNDKFQGVLCQIVRDKSSCYLDFSGISHKYEIKYLVRKFASLEGFFMSHSMVEIAAHLIQANATNKSMAIAGKTILFKHKKMFIKN